jgi:hypothetical protein
MRFALAAVVAFAFLAWDIGRNNGRYARQLDASMDGFTREVRGIAHRLLD